MTITALAGVIVITPEPLPLSRTADGADRPDRCGASVNAAVTLQQHRLQGAGTLLQAIRLHNRIG